jgi:hypothetical protein
MQKVYPPSLHLAGDSRIVGGCVEVCLWQISRDLVSVHPDLRFAASVMVADLVRWSFEAFITMTFPLSTTTTSTMTSFAQLE